MAGARTFLQARAGNALRAVDEAGVGLTVPSIALAGASVALLLLHVLARHRIRWVRRMLYGVWLLTVLGCAAGIGWMAYRSPFGAWTLAEVVGGLLLAAVGLRAVAALARPGSWLTAEAA
jgi:hypothetical protein